MPTHAVPCGHRSGSSSILRERDRLPLLTERASRPEDVTRVGAFAPVWGYFPKGQIGKASPDRGPPRQLPSEESNALTGEARSKPPRGTAIAT